MKGVFGAEGSGKSDADAVLYNTIDYGVNGLLDTSLFDVSWLDTMIETQPVQSYDDTSVNPNEIDFYKPLPDISPVEDASINKVGNIKRFVVAPHVDRVDASGKTQLYNAVLKRKFEKAEKLIQNGANLDLQCSASSNPKSGIPITGRTPLHCAVQKSQPNFVILLLNAGANPNIQDAKGNTPLHLVHLTALNSLDIVRYLLSYGANPEIKNHNGKLPIQVIAAYPSNRRKCNIDWITELFDHPMWSIPHRPDYTLCNELHEAIKSDKLPEVQDLLGRGADINELYTNGCTALSTAVQSNRKPNFIEMLVERGADLNLQSINRDMGFTPLHYAVKKHSNSLLRLLLSLKANPNIQDAKGNTPLHYVIESSSSLSNVLMNYGANPLILNNDRRYPEIALSYLKDEWCELQKWFSRSGYNRFSRILMDWDKDSVDIRCNLLYKVVSDNVMVLVGSCNQGVIDINILQTQLRWLQGARIVQDGHGAISIPNLDEVLTYMRIKIKEQYVLATAHS